MKFKYTGKLKKTKHKNKVYHCLAMDTETRVINDGKGNITFPFRLGVAIYFIIDENGEIYEQTTHEFYTQRTFIEILNYHMSKDYTLLMFAHNVGFDIRVLDLVKYFNNNLWLSEPPVLNGRLFIWSVNNHGKALKILDTANYGVQSIAQLGKDFGLSKGNVDFDTVDDTELITYCIRDVELVVRFMSEFIKFCATNKLGELQVSLASQSLYSFRTRFLHKDIELHNDRKVIELERQAYHGGRVECFRIGQLPKEDYYYLDINSMYPYIMLTMDLPSKLLGIQYDVPVEYLRGRLNRYYAIADVSLDTFTNAYPYIHNKLLVFPTGKFRATLHNEELRIALNNGDISHIHSCAVYDKDILFDKYVKFFYNIKQKASIEHNASWRFISKLFMNSLYGKFGQSGVDRQIIGNLKNKETWRVTCHDATEGIRFQEIAWNGVVYREIKQGEAYISFPALAGAITSEARCYLYSLIQKCGYENVLYTDTDSIITNSMGFNNLKDLLDDTELGKLKVEHQSQDVTIYNCKDYEFADIHKTKGIPTKATRISKDVWQYLQFEGFSSWLSGEMDKGATGKISTRTRRTPYQKGYVSPDGYVNPFVLMAD